MAMNLFQKAAKKSYRFPSNKGGVYVEDLYQMPLESKGGFSLNDVAKTLYQQIQDSEELSFVNPSTITNVELEEKLEIVKTIIADIQADRKAASDRKAKAEKKQKILAIMADKQDESLKGMSEENLQKMLEDL